MSYSLDGRLFRDLSGELSSEAANCSAMWQTVEDDIVCLTVDGSVDPDRSEFLSFQAMREVLVEVLDQLDNHNRGYNHFLNFRLEITSCRMLIL